jgi:hypothetical protein
MMLTAAAANLLWSGAALRARARFQTALQQPWRWQGALLEHYLRANRDTVVGRARGFSRLLAACPGKRVATACSVRRFAAAYQAQVPVSTYDDLEPSIARVRAGEPRVLTDAPVTRLLPSSGSTAAAKLVPCTAAGQRELSRAVDAWIGDLFLSYPTLTGGPAYWSISPAIASDRTSAVAIGFDDDSAYLGGVRQALARAILAVPDAVSRVHGAEAFRYVTLLFLARARDLRLVSVWHPTFLTRLLSGVPVWFDRIVQDLADGTVSTPEPIGDGVRNELQRHLGRHARRAKELARLREDSPSAIWPRVAAVSCWADGPAAPYVGEVQRLFPGAAFQAKGLVATEGIVTIPFTGRHPVAVTSHFFEFIESHDGESDALADSGEARLVHELETGREYVVLLTTGSGLYRYRLGDRVRVDGWVDGTPSLRFIGKDDRVVDYFGEKMSDGFVAGVIDALFAGPRPRFAMVAPERTSAGVSYTLFVEPTVNLPAALSTTLERALRNNPHYAWCVDMGQLRPSRVVVVGPHADRAYVDSCVARGQRLGDVKPVSLHRDCGWQAVLPSANQPSVEERAAC